MRHFFKKLLSQKGMSGVLVALLLVFVGVALVATTAVFMNETTTSVQNEVALQINSTIN
jgi:Tfp pilus assembly protein PilV